MPPYSSQRIRFVASAFVAALVAGFLAGQLRADDSQGSTSSSLQAIAGQCVEATFDHVRAPGTGTSLLMDSVERIAAALSAPAFCRVRAHIHTARQHGASETDKEIQIELRLPDGWNRKYLQYGGGGSDGAIERAAIPLSTFGADRPTGDVLTRGYAIAATDGGHVGNGIDFGWLRNVDGTINIDRYRNFAYRGRHLLAVAAKQLIAAYYGVPPSRSYHGGTSNGGRAGLLAAQRFPEDFDGIVVHAPAGAQEGQSAAWLRIMKAQYPTDSKTAVFPADGPGNLLPVLAKVTMARCDPADGLVDGVIADPAACDFKVRRDLPACKNGPAADCFTPDQMNVLEQIYSGSGTYPPFLPGYEADPAVGLPVRVFGPGGAFARGYPSQMYGFIEEVVKYWVYNDPAQTVQAAAPLERMTGRWPSGLDYAEFLADNPDLSAFKRRGGRLLMTQGLSDPLISPLAVERYYQRVMTAMGGAENTIEFARFFLVPGQGHNTQVAEGVPSNFNWLDALERWVENGVAPDYLIGTATGRSRPICRYPLKATAIDRNRSLQDAANFTCK